MSQSAGDDAHDGRSGSSRGSGGPWKTLAKASQITYRAGDRLLLKCGDIWTDGLELKGGGTADAPVTVASYGTGRRPVIDRQDSTMAALKRGIHLNGNGSGWKIANLEIANAARGIEASLAGPAPAFVWFENLDIHGCKFGKRFDQNSGDQNNMQTGLRISGSVAGGKATIRSCTFRDNFVGVLSAVSSDIKDCLFEHMEWTGLWYVAAEGGIIRGNKFMHNCDQYVWCGVSASALGGVRNCVVEYNEFGETQVVDGAVDGEDLDFEAGCRNVTMRYNLFHDSAGPASMLYNGAGHDQPNFGLAIHDNVFLHAAANPSAKHYNCTFLLSDGNTGAITRNRIYPRSGVRVYAGSKCPGVTRTGNTTVAIEDEPRGDNQSSVAGASASSNGENAAKVKDNDAATCWTGKGASGEWVQLDFRDKKTLDEFIVEQAPGSSIDRFVLQHWDGAAWKDLFTSYGPMGPCRYLPTWPVSTSRVRLFIESTKTGLPSISELKAFHTQGPVSRPARDLSN